MDYWKEGYQARMEGHPFNRCPITNKSNRREWEEGWHDASVVKYQREENEKWGSTAESCPWRNADMCRASDLICSAENCAVEYLREQGI